MKNSNTEWNKAKHLLRRKSQSAWNLATTYGAQATKLEIVMGYGLLAYYAGPVRFPALLAAMGAAFLFGEARSAEKNNRPLSRKIMLRNAAILVGGLIINAKVDTIIPQPKSYQIEALWDKAQGKIPLSARFVTICDYYQTGFAFFGHIPANHTSWDWRKAETREVCLELVKKLKNEFSIEAIKYSRPITSSPLRHTSTDPTLLPRPETDLLKYAR